MRFASLRSSRAHHGGLSSIRRLRGTDIREVAWIIPLLGKFHADHLLHAIWWTLGGLNQCIAAVEHNHRHHGGASWWHRSCSYVSPLVKQMSRGCAAPYVLSRSRRALTTSTQTNKVFIWITSESDASAMASSRPSSPTIPRKIPVIFDSFMEFRLSSNRSLVVQLAMDSL